MRLHSSAHVIHRSMSAQDQELGPLITPTANSANNASAAQLYHIYIRVLSLFRLCGAALLIVLLGESKVSQELWVHLCIVIKNGD